MFLPHKIQQKKCLSNASIISVHFRIRRVFLLLLWFGLFIFGAVDNLRRYGRMHIDNIIEQ